MAFRKCRRILLDCHVTKFRWALHLRPSIVSRFPKRLVIFGWIMLFAAFGLIVQHQICAALKFRVLKSLHMENIRLEAPNSKHVWWSDDIFFQSGSVTGIGHAMFAASGNWSAVCMMDNNGDGISNGQHLGDPCCKWQPSNNNFNLEGKREYRRWHLTHPDEPRDESLKMIQSFRIQDKPTNCHSSYDVVAYKEQFSKWYFSKADGAHEDPGYNILKIACLLVMLAIAANWVMYKGLLADVLPWIAASDALTWRVRVSVCFASFVYMDLTSGIIHLVLDYAPFTLPGLGILARGFQYHHDDPTAIIRISWFEYVSHIHFLCPLIQLAVVLSDASRLQRLFWFWGGIWAHLFQTAHRWAHMPPTHLPWIVQVMQSSGLLLSHEQHMSHHEDLERQFTILSGHTDFILDKLTWFVPPARYDLWFLFGVFWFLIPIFADAGYRDVVHKLEGTAARCPEVHRVKVTCEA